MSTELGAVCALVKGGLNPQQHTGTLFAHYSIPAFDLNVGPVIETGAGIRSQKTPIPSGVVLVSKLNPRIPRVWHVDGDQPHQRICSTEFVPLLPDPDVLAAEYLAFALREALQAGFIKGNTAAATKSRERAKPADFLRLKIRVPALSEQRRIVDLLSRAENIVRMRREAEQKAKEIIPALFLDMFGDPATNPRAFPSVPLSSLIREGDHINYGVLQPGEDMAAGVPLVRVGDLRHGAVSHAALKRIDPTIERGYRRSRLRGDEVLMSCVGSIGTVAIADVSAKGFNIARAVARIPVAPHVDSKFVAAYLSTGFIQRYLLSEARTVSQPTLNIKQLSETVVRLPPPELQRRFSGYASQMRKLSDETALAQRLAGDAFRALLARVFGEGA